MDSILTSCRQHGTFVTRLKEGWQRWVLLKDHWTRTRCKAGDSRERGCWRLWQPRDPRGHSATAANGFVSPELAEIPAFGSSDRAARAITPRLGFPPAKAAKVSHSRMSATLVRTPFTRYTGHIPLPRGEGMGGGATNGNFECPS